MKEISVLGDRHVLAKKEPTGCSPVAQADPHALASPLSSPVVRPKHLAHLRDIRNPRCAGLECNCACFRKPLKLLEETVSEVCQSV
jgi:hypothetical protein